MPPGCCCHRPPGEHTHHCWQPMVLMDVGCVLYAEMLHEEVRHQHLRQKGYQRHVADENPAVQKAWVTAWLWEVAMGVNCCQLL